MRAWLRRLIGPDREYILCDHDQPASAFSAYAGSERTGMVDFGHGTSIRKRWDGHLELTFHKDYYIGTLEGVDIFYAGHFMAHADIVPSVTCVEGSATVVQALDFTYKE